MFCQQTINLELYWQGSYTLYHKGFAPGQITTLDIKMEESTHKISANINNTLSPKQEQALNFRLSREKNSYFILSRIKCPIVLANSMKISARFFRVYNLSTRKEDLPVFIGVLPTFEINQTYQVSVLNQNNTLLATFKKKAPQVVTPQKMLATKTSATPTTKTLAKAAEETPATSNTSFQEQNLKQEVIALE